MNAWSWIEALGRSGLEGGLLILAVWAVCRLWPSIPAWTRSGLWWLASARLLLGLLPLAQVAIEAPMPVTAVWWPAALASTPAPPEVVEAGAVGSSAVGSQPGEPTASRAAVPSIHETRMPLAWDPRWIPIALVAVWTAGFGLRVTGLARHGRRVRAALQDARAVPEGLAGVLGVGWGVRLAVSSRVPVPLVTGLLGPTVLVPDTMLGLPDRDLRLALFHELAHVRRGDLWLAWVPAVADAVFWFHPLVRRCVREYVLACEEACDAEALRATGAHPHDYGRLLLTFGVHGRLAGATAMPCGSPSARQLVRRLSMLKPFVPSRPRVRNAALGLLCAFALVGLVPLRVVPTAAAPGPSPVAVPQGAEAPPMAVALRATQAPSVAERGEDPETPEPSGDELEDSDLPDEDLDLDAPDDEADAPPAPPARAPRTPHAATAPRPARATPRVAPVAPVTPHAPRAPRAPRSGVSWRFDDSERQRFAYVLVHVGEGSSSGSGNMADWQEVKRLETRLGHDFLWVRTGDDRYVIDDEDLLQQAEDAFRPQREVGQRQSEIGDQQSRIGDRQSEIGEQQSRIGERQSRIAERQAKLSQQMARREVRRTEARDLDRQMEELDRQMDDLSREMDRLGRRMEPLGEQQEELGARMETLSREMARVSRESDRRLRTLVDKAVRSGAARPLR